MALKKTQLLDITSVTGISTVGIFTAGVTATAAGTASTTYIKNVIMHNTGLGTARVSLYLTLIPIQFLQDMESQQIDS